MRDSGSPSAKSAPPLPLSADGRGGPGFPGGFTGWSYVFLGARIDGGADRARAPVASAGAAVAAVVECGFARLARLECGAAAAGELARRDRAGVALEPPRLRTGVAGDDLAAALALGGGMALFPRR